MTKQEFLAFSLPYGLKLFNKNCEHKRMYEMDGLFTPNAVHCKETNRVDYFHCEIMPILRPLSDLIKEIEHNGDMFFPIDELNNICDDELDRYNDYFDEENTIELDWFQEPFIIFKKLIEWHFDIADLISKGEAIDVNTLNVNPYK